MKWSEKLIARALVRWVFKGKYLLMVPNCYWNGEEVDVFCITENLRIVDVEVKISRSDFKNDMNKDKWYHSWDWRKDGPYTKENEHKRRVRDWPKNVWKHYYAMPKDIWKPELMALVPPKSGVILLTQKDSGEVSASMIKRAVPNRLAKQIAPEDAIDIARLASLRLWDTYKLLDEYERKDGSR